MNRSVGWVVLAVVVPIAVAGALVPVRDSMTSANLALVMLAGAVAVAAASTRVTVSVVCAVVTGVAYDFFLVRPYYSVTIADPAEALTAALVLVVVVIVGTVSQLFRRQQSLTEEREENLGLLYQLVDQVANAAGEAPLIAASEREIATLLGAKTCHYSNDLAEVGEATDIFDAYVDQIGVVRVEDDLWAVDDRGLPDRRLRIPVQSGGLRFGCFIVEPTPGQHVERWALIVAVMVADLVGSALARWPSDDEL